MMSRILLKSADYTDKDFDSLRERLISLIRTAFPTWTDFAVADFGTLLLESFAYIGDVLCFNQDAAAREARMPTATQLRNIIALAKLVGYKPRTAAAASSTATIAAVGVLAADCPIPAGTIVKTRGENPVRFQVLETATLTPGAPSAVVTVENSLSHAEQLQSRIRNGTALPNQEFVLVNAGIIGDTIKVTTALGEWVQVPNFLRSASDRHYEISVDSNERATVRFGNGICGQLPNGVINIAYRTGGGSAGIVDENAIKDVEGTFSDALGNSVTLTVTASTRAVGGKEREDAEEIRVNAPESAVTSERTVSRLDFEARALSCSGVARALMLTRAEWPAVTENQGRLYIVPTGEGFLTSAIRSAIAAQFERYPYWPTFVLYVDEPYYLDVGVRAVITLAKNATLTSGQWAARVKAAVLANLEAYFALDNVDGSANTNVDFGFNQKDASGKPIGSLALSDIQNVVRDTAGVARIGDGLADFQVRAYRRRHIGTTLVQDYAHSDVPIGLQDFPRLRQVGGVPDVVLINAETGLEI